MVRGCRMGEANHLWLQETDNSPVAYGEGLRLITNILYSAAKYRYLGGFQAASVPPMSFANLEF